MTKALRAAVVVALLAALSALASPAMAAPGDLTLASVNGGGTAKGNGASTFPSLSDDGTKVVFLSTATNLVPADTDTVADVYVKDITTGAITVVSTTSGGTKANGDSANPVISADGTKVAFASFATNLDPGDTDTLSDIYVKDLTTGNLRLVSTDDAGHKVSGASSTYPSLSGNGSEVSFHSDGMFCRPRGTG
jgi:hypothetical protein